MLTLRKFLYLDDVAVDDYLAQISGAVSAEEEVVEESGTGVGVGVSVPVLKANAGKEGRRAVSRTGKIPPGARFAKLYDALEPNQGFRYFSEAAPADWKELRRGQLIECDVEIVRGKLHQLVTAANAIEPLVDFFPNNDGTAEAIRGLSGMSKMAASRGLPLAMSLVDTPKYQLVAYLDEAHLLSEPAGLHGTATVFCKIQRLLKPGESLDLSGLSDFASMGLPNREAKRRAKKSGPASASAIEPRIGFPAAEVTVVAIYR